MKVLKSLLTLCVLAVSLTAFGQNDPVQLRLNLGEGFQVPSKNTIEMDMDMMGVKMKMRLEFDAVVSRLDDESTAERTVISMLMEDVVISMDVDGETLIYNTRTGENNVPEDQTEIIAAFAMMEDMDMHMAYDQYGAIIEITNAEEVVDAMLSKMKNNEGLDSATMAMMRPSLVESIRSEGGMNQSGLSAVQYPEEAVRIGSSWTDDQTLSGGMLPLNLVSTYTVSDIRDGKVYVDVSSQMSDAGGNPLKELFDAAGSFSGTVVIDAETGWVVSNTMEVDMSTSTELDNEGAKESEALEMKMFMRVTSTSQVN